MSGFSKVLAQGPAGSVVVSEAAGVATIAAVASLDVGGGNVKGFVKVRSTNEIDVDASELIYAGIDLLVAKVPSLAPEAAVFKGLVAAELAKV